MRKYFTFRFHWAILASLALVGCKKDEEDFQSYIRMEVDGQQVECTSNITATGHFGHPTQVISISGFWSNTPLGSGAIEIELWDYDNTPGEKQFLPPSMITIFLDPNNSTHLINSDKFVAGAVNAKLNIIEVNKAYIRGTFECTSSTMRSNGEVIKKSFTNGKFHVKRG